MRSRSVAPSPRPFRRGSDDFALDPDDDLWAMPTGGVHRPEGAGRRGGADRLESADAGSKPQEGTASSPSPAGSIHLEAALIRQRGEALQDLWSGYPTAGPAEKLLLRLAASDAVCFRHMQDAELALATKVHETLLSNPGNVLAVARALKDVAIVSSAIRNRVQASLTAASTLMAQRRLAQVYRPGVDE